MKYPSEVRPGTLLRTKEHCRKSRAVLENGEYALIVPKLTKAKTGILWDVLFPSGQRMIFMPTNWEIVSY